MQQNSMKIEDKNRENEETENTEIIVQQLKNSEYTYTNNLKFQLIIKFFTKLSQTRGRQKAKLVKTFVNFIFKQNRNHNFTYSIIRLLLPFQDRERGNYGLKQKTLATIIKNSLGLNKQDYQRLRHYKNPSYHLQDGYGVGDFPSVVYSISQRFCKKISQITIEEVNQLLDELVMKTETKQQTVIFTQFYKICTADQIKWITRIILKDINLGIKSVTVLSQFHDDAYDYYNLTNSLKQVCKKFQDKNISLKNEIMLFQPIRPMLAGKRSLEYFDYQQKQFILETKFDGQRLQVHTRGSEIKLFSRNGKDYTHLYKQIIPLLRTNISAHACILDGEILVVEKQSHSMVPFGMNKMVALNKSANQTQHLQICYKIFDVLYIKYQNQEASLMAYPIKKRKAILQKFIKQQKGQLEIVRGQIVKGTDQVTKKFYQSLERCQQGIIVKDPQSIYIPNDRGNHWIKLKGDYFEGLTDTLDLLIIGGYYGQQSYRTGVQWTDKITTFLLGVISYLDISNPKSTHIIPFCKVGTGYNQANLNDLRIKLKRAWIKNDGKKPSYLIGNWKPKLDDRPDCFIDSPHNSVILEIKGAELIKSDAFGAQKTVRFPRVAKIRYDKDWHEALKFEQLQVLMSEEYTKNMKKRIKRKKDSQEQGENVQNINQEDKLTKKIKGKEKKERQILNWFKSVEINESDVISNLFTGIQFMVLNLKNELQKKSLEYKILINGGAIVQNPLASTTHIICQSIDFKLKILNSQVDRNYLFIKPSYIYGCIQEKRIINISPLYLLVIPQNKLKFYNTNFDKYGDNYTQFLNLRQLNQLIQQGKFTDQYVDKEVRAKIQPKKIYEGIIYTQKLQIQDRINLRLKGYKIVDKLQSGINMIMINKKADKKCLKQISQFLEKNKSVKLQYIETFKEKNKMII